ncbi:hypothetical protein [Fictibacillus phosphorivorans]|uniref:hypothetical protein n=1 Tax=Fictibacillus phosphorivorans TaxID=1221500 RepID=UPI00203F7698|nr:hypothetical protein [Fictibacillus phosphorivorans]MCM3720102.1 hypothetical protein [Fictibacillus phosphorivorans]MCM3777792.1 hypothetical protein [Fictibacillus phosphorivorans]
MKKMILSLALILLIGVLVYNLFMNQSIDASYSLEKEDIQHSNFLEDKKAVMYFSTTADQDMDDKGISLAVFLNNKGEADAYQMKSLELGNLSVHDREVMLTDKNSVRLIGNHYKEFNMKKSQYTGERSGYLKAKDLHVTIFNTGVNKNGGYDSNVWYGNNSGFQTANIPHYILASGITDNEVLILAQDIEKNLYSLKNVMFKESDVHVKDLVTLDNKTNSEYSVRSPILSDQDYYYFILSEFVNNTSEHTVLFSVHKKTRKQEKIQLDSYSDEKHPTASIPYNVKNSAYLNNGILYYLNGLGEIITFDTQTKKVDKPFTLKNAPQDGVRHNEEIYFNNDHVYVLRYDEDTKEKYRIEKYSLVTGEQVETIKINGLDDILKSIKGKSIHSYDFKMLN